MKPAQDFPADRVPVPTSRWDAPRAAPCRRDGAPAPRWAMAVAAALALVKRLLD